MHRHVAPEGMGNFIEKCRTNFFFLWVSIQRRYGAHSKPHTENTSTYQNPKHNRTGEKKLAPKKFTFIYFLYMRLNLRNVGLWECTRVSVCCVSVNCVMPSNVEMYIYANACAWRVCLCVYFKIIQFGRQRHYWGIVVNKHIVVQNDTIFWGG